jgi:hypothetical protein
MVHHRHEGNNNPQRKPTLLLTVSNVVEATLTDAYWQYWQWYETGELEEVVGEMLRDKLQLDSP